MLATSSVQSQLVLASWDYSPQTKIYAVKQGNNVFFDVGGATSSITELALNNIRGWIPPEDADWNSDLASFYEQFKPVILDESELIFSIVDREIFLTPEKTIRIVISIDKKTPHLWIQSDKVIHSIPVENIYGKPAEIFQPVKGKISRGTIDRINKVAIVAINLDEKKVKLGNASFAIRGVGKKLYFQHMKSKINDPFGRVAHSYEIKKRKKIALRRMHERLYFQHRLSKINDPFGSVAHSYETKRRKKIALERMHERLRYFNFRWGEHFNDQITTLSIHENFFVPLNSLITDLAFYWGIDDTNPLSMIEALLEKNVFSLSSGNLIKSALTILLKFRYQQHLHYQEQKDDISSSNNNNFKAKMEKMTDEDLEIIYIVLEPLYYCLSCALGLSPEILYHLQASNHEVSFDDGKNLFEDVFKNLDLENCKPVTCIFGMTKLPFVDLIEKNEMRLPFVTIPLPGRKAAPGLNLIGICLNSDCVANNKEVLIQKKFGSFNMTKLVHEAACPCCGNLIENVNNCGFFDCIFSIKGEIKDKEGEPKKIDRSAIAAPDNEFLSFKGATIDGDSISEYFYLKITTEPKSKASLCEIM